MDKEFEWFFIIVFFGGIIFVIFFEVWECEYVVYIFWFCIYFYWVDECCVLFGDDQSNFGLVYCLLFSKVGIFVSYCYCIVGEGVFEEEVKQYFFIVKIIVLIVDGVFVFDFVLLGIGEDGYILFIFFDYQEFFIVGELYEVFVNFYNKIVCICMMGCFLIEVWYICFLVMGENKCSILKEIFDKNKEGVYLVFYIWYYVCNL